MPLTGKRMFYIEDDIKNRSIVQLILERERVIFGYHQDGMRDLADKLRAFMPVDIILLDLMFPDGVTGYQIYEYIRNYPEFNGIPVVIVTSSDPAIEMPRVRRTGFSGFISKPVNMITFPDYMMSILKGETVWV